MSRIFWQRRWRQASSAERYLQAAAASTVLSVLLDAVRARVAYFDDASDVIAASFLDVGPAAWPRQHVAARQTT